MSEEKTSSGVTSRENKRMRENGRLAIFSSSFERKGNWRRERDEEWKLLEKTGGL